MSPGIGKYNQIRHIVRIRQMLRRWRKKAAAAAAGSSRSDVPAGHVAICVGMSNKRFVVRATYLNHPTFKNLLVQAEEEYGFTKQGPLVPPCDESVFEEILRVVSLSDSANSGLKDGEKTFYFTTRQSKYGHGKRSSRCANGGQGYWKMTSKFTETQATDGSILGKKNTLVYFRKNNKNNNGKDFKTNYIMHEYVLDDSQIVHKINNVVLCSIYLRKSAEEKKESQTRKESQQTTRDSNEDVQQLQPPLMLKGKRPRAEEECEPELEPEPQPQPQPQPQYRPQPQPQPQPQAYYQNNRFNQLRPWDTANEDISVFGEPSHTLEPKTLEVSNSLFPEVPLLEEESLSQVFQELTQGPLSATVTSQQPELIENTAVNEFTDSISPSSMIESQNTYVGNIGGSTDQLPIEMPLNLQTDDFITNSEFFGSSIGATTTSLEAFCMGIFIDNLDEVPFYNELFS